MTLMSGKEINKTIAPKEVNHGNNGESRGLRHEPESKYSESEGNKSNDKEHKSKSELSNKPSNEVTIQDLKHAPFPHKLTKTSKANLNVEIYDVFKQV